MKQMGASYQDKATAFKMNQPTLNTSWHIEFQKHGLEGLKEKRKGRVLMSAGRKSKRINQEEKMSREELLAHENEMLRLENAYLKKLKAFQENPHAFLEKHRQRWRSNSKKNDSN